MVKWKNVSKIKYCGVKIWEVERIVWCNEKEGSKVECGGIINVREVKWKIVVWW